MKKYFITLVAIAIGTLRAYSQDTLNTSSQKLKDELSNRKGKFSELQSELNSNREKREARLKKYQNNKSKKSVSTANNEIDGKTVELYDFENGIPVYRTTFNQNSAETIGTDRVRSGGELGFDLDGTNAPTIGIWDAGAVRTSHVELEGRVTQQDGSSDLNDHATHVAGTMIASGFDPSSMGMAPNATIDAYDWSWDDQEMLQSNLKLSNHSYGYYRGWSWSWSRGYRWHGDPSVNEFTDYQFGRYNSYSRAWDQIAHLNYKHLIVVSAGNDRNDKGPSGSTQLPDGIWDCIADYSVSKNTLTVGAVYDIVGGYTGPSSVVAASFSSWGPADDGRIKPDIVANGVSLKSSTSSSDKAYGNYSGTSMSSPSVTGSIALLHELESEMSAGVEGWSSTYKGLVIHSADEAGYFDGPDYSFGWGLMNTARASEIISFNYSGCEYSAPMTTELGLLRNIYELGIDRGIPKSYEVYKLEGKPLKVTIAWNDPAGNVGPRALNNRTPSLVNDIDLRLISPEGKTLFPWRLNPNNPEAAATTGDNNVDNVEQIIVNDFAAGKYRLILNMESTSRDIKEYISLIITGNDRIINNLTLSETNLDRNISNGESESLKVRKSLIIDDEYTIEDGGEIKFNASEITLKPGFHSRSGSNSSISLDFECNGLSSLNRNRSASSNNRNPEIINEEVMNELTNVKDALYEQLKIHPNPVTDFLTLEFGVDQIRDIENISITTLQGQILLEKKQDIGNTETINFSSFAKGIYVVNILLKDGEKVTRKIIKK